MKAHDPELLARYLDTKDETAFSQLVDLYAGLVLSAALSVTGEIETAREASQNTFITLARKGPSLRGRDSLGGWLHQTAMLSARNLVRSRRREERKRRVLEASIVPDGPGANEGWEELRPILDESLASLPKKDRDAVVMRFYRGFSVAEVASAMQVTLAAAQKRLGRATKRLQANFQRRGVTLSVPALTSGLALWMGKSQCTAATCLAWAGKAIINSSDKAGSSFAIDSISNVITKSKPFTALIVAALVIGAGVIALRNSHQRTERTLLSGSSVPSKSPARRSGGGIESEGARRYRELEARFGDDHVRQARSIVTFLLSGVDADMEKAREDLDRQSARWMEGMKLKWDLDELQVKAGTELIGAIQDARIRNLEEARHKFGGQRNASYAEAILLADQVSRGELTPEEFDDACEHLTKIGSLRELESQMTSAFRFGAYLHDEEFSAAVAEVLPPGKQARFRQEMKETSTRVVESQLSLFKTKVPDLSLDQITDLEANIRKLGPLFPNRGLVSHFLTDAQNDAWRTAEEERTPEKRRGITRVHTTDANGTLVELHSPPMRPLERGQVPVYPWSEPMTLDEAEREARKLAPDDNSPQSPDR